MNEYLVYGSYYLALINAITFILFGLDKYKALKSKWRISEGTLLLFCLIGGTSAGYIAMLLFRHKTRKPKFRFGIPAIAILQMILIINTLKMFS